MGTRSAKLARPRRSRSAPSAANVVRSASPREADHTTRLPGTGGGYGAHPNESGCAVPLGLREFRRVVQKGATENYFIDKYLFRHISLFGSYAMARLGVQPNTVTALSLACTLTAVWFLMQTSAVALLIGCALILMYHYLDHVDGELARFYQATKGAQYGISGVYFDVLCHSFTANLWLPAIAFAVYRETGQPLVVLLGIAAMPAMSSFAQLVGTHVFSMQLVKDPQLLQTAPGQDALQVLSGRHRQVAVVQAGLFNRAGAAKLAKEIVGYPGMIFLIVLAVMVDLITGGVWARLAILVILTGFHGANNVRRAVRIMRRFRQIA